MVELVCAVVGVELECLALVDAELTQTVEDLTKTIVIRLRGIFADLRILAAWLKLHLAYRKCCSGSEWLPAREGGQEPEGMWSVLAHSDAIEKHVTLQACIDVVGLPPLSSAQTHIIVDIGGSSKFVVLLKKGQCSSPLPRSGACLEMFDWTVDDHHGTVQDMSAIHDIAPFVSPLFYVRREMIYVLSEFRRKLPVAFGAGKIVVRELVMRGGGGSGKSSVAALICFYIAVKLRRPVIMYRHVLGSLESPMTWLLYNGSYFKWPDPERLVSKHLMGALQSMDMDRDDIWSCAIGTTRMELKHAHLHWFPRLIVTPRLYYSLTHSMSSFRFPYWREEDMHALAVRYLGMDEREFAARYFVSGGNLRMFFDPEAKRTVTRWVEYGDKPHPPVATYSDDGSIRMGETMRLLTWGFRGFDRPGTYSSYPEKVYHISSAFALQHLIALVSPSYFVRAMTLAQHILDHGIESLSFAGYIHSCAWRHQPLTIQIVHDLSVHLQLEQLAIVKMQGDTFDECVQLMTVWASDLSSIDYWMPKTSVGCGMPDAVTKITLPQASSKATICFLRMRAAPAPVREPWIFQSLAQPFVDLGVAVRFLTVLPGRGPTPLEIQASSSVFGETGVLEIARLPSAINFGVP